LTKVKLFPLLYTWIGPKFGDDGLDHGTPYVSDHVWRCAMQYVGDQIGVQRTLDTTRASDGQSVEFLSRVYPNPSLSLTSYCKVMKACAKLSIAINRDRDKYILKLRGYWTTDKATPVVGAYIKALSNLYKIELEDFHSDADFAQLEEVDRDLYHKVEHGPYPTDASASMLSYQCVAAELGEASGGALQLFDEKLRICDTWLGIAEMLAPCAKVTEDRTLWAPNSWDPLRWYDPDDPPGVKRQEAFSCMQSGLDPRIEDFEAVQQPTEGGKKRKEPPRSPRKSAAAAAVQPVLRQHLLDTPPTRPRASAMSRPQPPKHATMVRSELAMAWAKAGLQATNQASASSALALARIEEEECNNPKPKWCTFGLTGKNTITPQNAHLAKKHITSKL
jgi:hypothetical protein